MRPRTSVIFGRTLMMKMFRRVDAGPNPDVELSGVLTRTGFAQTPALIGTVAYVGEQGAPASLLMQRDVPNRGHGWAVSLAALHDYLESADDTPEGRIDDPAIVRRYV